MRPIAAETTFPIAQRASTPAPGNSPRRAEHSTAPSAAVSVRTPLQLEHDPQDHEERRLVERADRSPHLLGLRRAPSEGEEAALVDMPSSAAGAESPQHGWATGVIFDVFLPGCTKEMPVALTEFDLS